MRSSDEYVRGLDTLTHEAGHAVAVYMLGAKLVRIIGARHRVEDPFLERGSVEWLGPLPPEAEAFVLLAGRAAAEGADVLLPSTTADERIAATLVDSSTLERLRGEVLIWTWRKDVSAAIRALCDAVAANDGLLSGPTAEEVLRGVV